MSHRLTGKKGREREGKGTTIKSGKYRSFDRKIYNHGRLLLNAYGLIDNRDNDVFYYCMAALLTAVVVFAVMIDV